MQVCDSSRISTGDTVFRSYGPGLEWALPAQWRFPPIPCDPASCVPNEGEDVRRIALSATRRRPDRVQVPETDSGSHTMARPTRPLPPRNAPPSQCGRPHHSAARGRVASRFGGWRFRTRGRILSGLRHQGAGRNTRRLPAHRHTQFSLSRCRTCVRAGGFLLTTRSIARLFFRTMGGRADAVLDPAGRASPARELYSHAHGQNERRCSDQRKKPMSAVRTGRRNREGGFVYRIDAAPLAARFGQEREPAPAAADHRRCANSAAAATRTQVTDLILTRFSQRTRK